MSTADNTFTVTATEQMSLVALTDAFNLVFTGHGYPVYYGSRGFAEYCRRHNLDTGQSLVLREEKSGELAGLAMLGIRGWRGWVGGFGIVPKFRGLRLAPFLMAEVVAHCRRMELTELLLEVLVDNAPAFKTYQGAGFATTRTVGILTAEYRKIEKVMRIKPDAAYRVDQIVVEDAVRLLAQLEPPPPELVSCWEREANSLVGCTRPYCLLVRRNNDEEALLAFTVLHNQAIVFLQHLSFTHPAAALHAFSKAVQILVAQGINAQRLSFYLYCEPENTPFFKFALEKGFQVDYRLYEMINQL